MTNWDAWNHSRDLRCPAHAPEDCGCEPSGADRWRNARVAHLAYFTPAGTAFDELPDEVRHRWENVYDAVVRDVGPDAQEHIERMIEATSAMQNDIRRLADLLDKVTPDATRWREFVKAIKDSQKEMKKNLLDE